MQTKRESSGLQHQRQCACEVLNHKRPLTLAMIRKLQRSLGIAAEALIAPTVAG